MDDSAELFDAIAHPMRIKILKILEKEPATFASLKRQLNLESSGNLDHHLKKLGQLVTTQNGSYTLTEAGKQALTSVAAVEAWKESERLRLRAFAKKPLEVTVLTVLTLVATVMATLIVGQVVSSDALNVPFLPTIYLIAAAVGVLAFLGLLIGKGWGWTLALVQAVLVMTYVTVPLYFDLYAPNVLSIASTENPSPFVWIASGCLAIMGLSALLMATRKPVREFFGMQNATPLRKRALAGGALAVFCGLLELYAGSLCFFSQMTNAVDGVARTFGLSNYFVAGIPIALGGLAILLRKYTLGGVLVLVFSLFPLPYFYVGTIFLSLVGLTSVFPLYLFVVLLLVAMPYVAAAFAFASRPKTRE